MTFIILPNQNNAKSYGSAIKTAFILIIIFFSFFTYGQSPFITTWNLATAGSGASQLSFGVATSGPVNYTWQEISPGSASGSGTFSGSTDKSNGFENWVSVLLCGDIRPWIPLKFNSFAPILIFTFRLRGCTNRPTFSKPSVPTSINASTPIWDTLLIWMKLKRLKRWLRN